MPLDLKQVAMTMARGSLTAPLACAFLKQETIVRARNVVRIRVHGSGFEKLLGNGCLRLASIANVSETNRKNERVDVKSTSLVI